MKQYLGKDGLLQELHGHIERVIPIYRKMLNVDEKATVDYDIYPDINIEVYVKFERSYCGCCPGDTVDSFTITQAILENPEKEFEQMVEKQKKKITEREEKKKAKAREEKKVAREARKSLYQNLKKEFEK